MNRFAGDVTAAWERHVIGEGKAAQAVILVAFLATFVVVRAITHAIRAGRFRRLFRNVVTPGGFHLHHLVPGILTLLATGYVGIGVAPSAGRLWLAALFGIGAALTLDEFALWLNLKDVYWAKQGRDSIDAVVVAATLSALAILGWSFWSALGRAIGSVFGRF
ncbi:MAG TPA: hypothetical protein VER37_02080 [Thermomicrobiales bacterium]|nr:hypothetical protein [Thermomicrobiales bacterium]